MNSYDRLSSIATRSDEDQRFEDYLDLGEDISSEAAAPLSEIERSTLARLLTQERHPPSRNRLWYLAQISGRDDNLRDVALRNLSSREDPQRGSALRYLRLVYPELMPILFDQYRLDRDPHVSFELAMSVLPADRESAIKRLIDAVERAPQELGDEIWRYLFEFAEPSHIGLLWERDRAAGGHSLYGTIARSLEEKFSGDTRS
jgi:hypothetical protein